MEAVPPAVVDAVAVDDEDRLRQANVSELLGERVLVLPVDGRAAPVEEARAGERVGGGAEPAHRHAASRLAPEPAQERARGRRRDVEPAADHDHVLARELAQAHGHAELGAVRAAHADPAFAGHDPLVERPPRHTVGDAQGLHRAGEAEHREVGEEHEDEALGTRRRRRLGRDGLEVHARR
jgi:hypothetical protein